MNSGIQKNLFDIPERKLKLKKRESSESLDNSYIVNDNYAVCLVNIRGLGVKTFSYLIPDEMMISMLSSHIDNTPATAGFILDGFPRTVAQAEALQNMLEQREGAQTILVDLEVDKDELINRLLKRGETSGRSDDNLETIQKRLEVYETKTKPVNDYYKAKGLHARIDGMGTIEEIFQRIVKALEGKI